MRTGASVLLEIEHVSSAVREDITHENVEQLQLAEAAIAVVTLRLVEEAVKEEHTRVEAMAMQVGVEARNITPAAAAMVGVTTASGR